MKLAFAQINPTVGDVYGNVHRIIAALGEARTNKADIVLFPELVVLGYPPKDLLLRRRLIVANKQALTGIAQHTHGLTAIVGFVDEQDGKLYNSAAIFQNGKLLGVQHKTHLPNYDVFDEKRYFAQATDYVLFTVNGTPVGVTICEDIWLDGPVEELVRQGAKLILNISASPYTGGKERIREDVLKKRSSKNAVPIAYCNLVGGQDDIVFDGHSCYVDERGSILYEAPSFREGVFICDTTMSMHVPDTDDDVAHVYKALVLAIKDYFRKNGFTKAILGLSGGIDSALTAVLAVEALGRENVLGVTMPSTYSSRGSVDDSERLARSLGIILHTVPIQSVVNAYKEALRPVFKDLPENVAEENIQARVRGNLLMAISNKFGYLVLSTGNKSELAVGYCTIYGDMCGGVAVIADVPKTTVYKLARYHNALKGQEIIPENTLTKAPSAELRPGQKDSDSLPDYDVLDLLLDASIEQGMERDDLLAQGFAPEMVDKVLRLLKLSEYKRYQAALGFKVTSKAFGSGRRIPITNGWNE